MFEHLTGESIIARAQTEGLISIDVHNIRDYTRDRHRSVDDNSYGAGPGMVMKPEPLFKAVESIREAGMLDTSHPVILLTPQGRTLTQRVVEELSEYDGMALICGRYEGVDERVRQHLATDEISIGDYVLFGGELAAMVVVEAVSRLVPGVVGCAESPLGDSFTTGLLQHPLYTRPATFRDWDVPEVLLSGHHPMVSRWQRRESLRRTFERRPDMLDVLGPDDLSEDDLRFLEELRG